MKQPRDAKRRAVLKTLGAGIVGGTVLTGSATASSNGRTDIDLRGHNFTPNQANVSLGDDGSATVRWTNDEVKYSSEEFPVPHDVHLEHDESHLVESGIFTQMSTFDAPDPIGTVELGPTYYEVEFREEGSDLVIEEKSGKVASKGFKFPKPYELIEDYDTATIEDWGGSVSLDVHCSIHSIALDVNEGELVTRAIERGEPPYKFHLGFFKMDGGLKITR